MDPQADAADPVVFCSYSRVDEEVVKAFAARLRSDGIDAWFDRWEIQPGDDFVAKIDDVLRRYATALVFLSSTEGQTGRWAGVEWRTVTAAQVEWVEGRGRRVIPVLVDEGAEIPPLLLRLDHPPVTEYEAIRDAILGISAKPPLGPRYVANPADGPPPIVGVSGAGPVTTEQAAVGAVDTTSPEAEPPVGLPPVTEVTVSGTAVDASEATPPVSGVAV
ncbi:MAG TPA: toll/interleukin-1 receptor domain-containing protein, partial [Acidimicrobiales bacterium]|nr:toll/interleukin-1 receptor domain-containing protein [Acidimicrobiales bacterium]